MLLRCEQRFGRRAVGKTSLRAAVVLIAKGAPTIQTSIARRPVCILTVRAGGRSAARFEERFTAHRLAEKLLPWIAVVGRHIPARKT